MVKRRMSPGPAPPVMFWMEVMTMAYRCVATSMTGLVQQVVCNYLPHDYWFHVTGRVPEGKDAEAIDEKLIQKYGIDLSRQSRFRRKQRGRGNVHYVRFAERFILLATRGHHLFFREEKARIRDARKVPIRLGGYSLMCRRDGMDKKRYRVRVQVSREAYRKWLEYYVSRARELSAERLARELYGFPFEPYAPVRRQMLTILRVVNNVRSELGLEKLDWGVLRYRRRIVRPFESHDLDGIYRVANNHDWDCGSLAISDGSVVKG